MISILLASTLVFGDMDKTGSGKEFCEALNNYKGTTVVMNSNGGIVQEAAVATQCIQSKDVIVKVLKSQSAATYMLHGMPWKCYHPKAVITTHNVSDGKREDLNESRQFFLALNEVYMEWGVDPSKFMATSYAAIMTPFNSYVEISVEEARYYFGGVVCSVEGD